MTTTPKNAGTESTDAGTAASTLSTGPNVTLPDMSEYHFGVHSSTPEGRKLIEQFRQRVQRVAEGDGTEGLAASHGGLDLAVTTGNGDEEHTILVQNSRFFPSQSHLETWLESKDAQEKWLQSVSGDALAWAIENRRL